MNCLSILPGVRPCEGHQVAAIFSHVLTCVPPTYNFMLHLLLIIKLFHCYSIEERTETRIKLLKENDVGMLLQSTEKSYM